MWLSISSLESIKMLNFDLENRMLENNKRFQCSFAVMLQPTGQCYRGSFRTDG